MTGMMARVLRGALAGGVAVLVATAASAQQQHESVANHRDWFTYESGSGASRVCWIVSEPKSFTARRGNQNVPARDVNRGDAYLMVAIRPGANPPVRNEVSLIAGFTMRDNSAPRLEVGSTRFEMFARGGEAWSDPADDDRVVAALRGGSEAKVTSTSSRGTVITDTFSLLGFSAALDDARGRCR
jgi:invasion protein IalB